MSASQQAALTKTPISTATARHDNSPPYQNYYAALEKRYSAQKPMEQPYDSLLSPVLPNRPDSTPSSAPPATPPRRDSASNAAYLAGLSKYPYLRNSYLRRPKTYVSPYSASGYGFSAEWAARLLSRPADPLPAPFGPPLRPAPDLPPADRVRDIVRRLADADADADAAKTDTPAPAPAPRTPRPAPRGPDGTPTERPDWSPLSEVATPVRK